MPIELPFTTHVENGVTMLSPVSIPQAPTDMRQLMHSFMATYSDTFKKTGFIEDILILFRNHFQCTVQKAYLQNAADPGAGAILNIIKTAYDQLRHKIEQLRGNDKYQTMDECILFLFDGYDVDYLKTYKRTRSNVVMPCSHEWFMEVQRLFSGQ